MGSLNWPSLGDKGYLTEHQYEQLRIATQQPVGILCGFAGTGKTTLLAYLLKSLPASYSVAVVGPTGRASVRAEEVLESKGIYPVCGTVHRILIPRRNGHDQKGWNFTYNESNPLPYDVVIIDEAPMLPASLMASLLSAVKTGSLLLLVGDPEQLPPIECGRPLLDMVNAGLPSGILTQPLRYSGRIADVCMKIRNGESWEPSEKFNFSDNFPENHRHIEQKTPGGIFKMLVASIKTMGERGFDCNTEMQVITALRRGKGALSSLEINKNLRPILNPAGRSVGSVPFCVGDKVICTANDFRPEESLPEKRTRISRKHRNGIMLTEDEMKFMDETSAIAGCQYVDYDFSDENGDEFMVANGETGLIEDIGEENNIVFVKFPRRENCIMFSKKDWEDNLELAYAITCHKMQGSQSKLAIPIVDESYGARMVCSRAFHYTAFSRAEQALITIGRKTTIEDHCSRVDIHNRETRLKERIQEWYEPTPTAISVSQ